jgi:hypothetical protein
MVRKQIETFLSDLAVSRKVSAATQRQALNAIVFFYITEYWTSLSRG